jgi:AcrR family transcriptional regulator
MQDQALELFGRHGYELVTARQIAEASGVTERTFFRHFGNKEGVVLWYVDDERPVRLDASQAAAGIQAVAEHHARWLAKSERESKLLVARTLLIVTTPALRAQWLDKNHQRALWLADQVALLAGADQFQCRTIAAGVFAAACAAAELWAVAGGREPLDEVLDHAFDALRGREDTTVQTRP